MYKARDLKLFVDISTYCNAGCPQCHRTDPVGLGKAEWLPLIQWNIEEFKTAFPPQVLKVTKTLNLCGTWGDPIMNRDIDKIVEYVVSVSDCAVVIDTNGHIVTTALISPRDEEVFITTSDGERVEAEFLGLDSETHLAVIQAKEKKLAPITMAKSVKLSPGAWIGVVSISPENTPQVSQGIVSSVADERVRLNVFSS